MIIFTDDLYSASDRIAKEDLDNTFRTIRQFLNVYTDNIFYVDSEKIAYILQKLNQIVSLYEAGRYDMLFGNPQQYINFSKEEEIELSRLCALSLDQHLPI